jgi:putative endonuclease
MDKRAKGTKGEDVACVYLVNKGYKILKRNYYTQYGEIDIIAHKDDVIIFVEVKMRTSIKYGLGMESVNHRKIEKLRLCAQIYLQENELYNQSLRFDVIDILSGRDEKIIHLEAAF